MSSAGQMSGTPVRPFDNVGDAGDWHGAPCRAVGPTHHTNIGVNQLYMGDAVAPLAPVEELLKIVPESNAATFYDKDLHAKICRIVSNKDENGVPAMEAPSVYQTPLQAPPYGPDKQYEYNVSCHLDEIFTSSTQKSLNRGILHGLATPATFPHWRNQDITSVPGFTGKQIPQTEPFDYSRPSWLASVAAEMPTIAMFANSDPEVTTEEFFKEPSPFPKIDKRTQPNNLNVAIFQPMIPAPPGDISIRMGRLSLTGSAGGSAIAGTSVDSSRPTGVVRTQHARARIGPPYLEGDTRRNNNPVKGSNRRISNPLIVKRYPCMIPGCGFSAARSDGLSRHLKASFHNDIKDYKCVYCGKLDSRSDNRNFHQQHCNKNPNVSPGK